MLDFVIIGAQKGGSTALADALAQHPQVWMPADEQPVFRDPVHTPEGVRSLLADCANHPAAAARGIKCPDYLGRPEVPLRLRDEGGSPKIVACLRNPVSRAVSTYFWHVRWGMLPIEDPSVGLSKVLDGAYEDVDPTAKEILEWGRYGELLERYRATFPAERIHILLTDDIRTSPQQAFGSLYEFLEIDPGFEPVAAGRAANEGVYAPARLRFLRLRNRHVLRWDESRTYANIPPAPRVWPAVVSRSVAAADRFVLRHLVSNEPPALEVSVRTRLQNYYREDLDHLESVLGRDICAWR